MNCLDYLVLEALVNLNHLELEGAELQELLNRLGLEGFDLHLEGEALVRLEHLGVFDHLDRLGLEALELLEHLEMGALVNLNHLERG